MKPIALLCAASTLAAVAAIPRPILATAPFTENFATSTSNWTTGGGTPATFQPAGGPDGSSYASVTFTLNNIPFNAPIVMFRAQDEFNSSNHAFEGDWLASGINYISAYVRHNAPVSLGFFIRITPPNNFPGMIGEDFVGIPPNTWTRISYKLSPEKVNQNLFTEGEPELYYTSLSNVGHIQIGFRVPDGFNSNTTTYITDLDQPSIDRLPVPGDYNGNGLVDAADYVLWRNGGPLLNQIDDPSQINTQDYTAWRARFNSTLPASGSGSGVTAPVPEPPTIMLLLLYALPAAAYISRRAPSGWLARGF